MSNLQLDRMAMAEREIVISRLVNAPRAMVFRAWTDPAQLAKWWGPQGFNSTTDVVDVRVGGVFRLEMAGPNGVTCPCSGIFREVVEPERIVYVGTTDDGHPCGGGLPPRAVVTVTFAEQDGKTLLTIHTLLETVADRLAAIGAGYSTGWTSCLARLDEFVSGG